MFRKVNTPVLGVIENMSGLVLEGAVEGDVSAMTINGENVDLDNTGKFNFIMEVFKTGGGKKESERLGVPLLGKIPISPEIMSATDAGVPVAQKDPDSSLGQLYHQIVQNLFSSLD